MGSNGGGRLAAGVWVLGGPGFTGSDLAQLRDIHQSGVADCDWGRADLITNDFCQYLAIWDEPSFDHEPPRLAVIRFSQTGTYALLVGGAIVANGKRLDAILPALSVAKHRTAAAS